MPSMIQAASLSKTYRVAVYQKSLRGLLASVVRRQYRDIEAVRRVSFEVDSGTCLGLIGPNGAGKSTAIKLMTGVLYPTSGTITVNGIVPHQQRQRNARQIGVVFGQRSQLWYDLPVIDSFTLLRQIYEIPNNVYEANLAMLGARLGLSDFFHQPVRKLSLGQRMRADFAAALLHNPAVVFLDEPTIGLDVVAKEAVRDFVKYMNQQRGVTVILTTHDMSDVEVVSHRVLVMDHGTIIHDSTMAALRDTYARTREVRIQFRDHHAASRLASDAVLIARLGISVIGRNEQEVTLRFARDRYTAFELVAEVDRIYPVEDIETRDTPIESIIRTIYSSGSRQEVPA